MSMSRVRCSCQPERGGNVLLILTCGLFLLILALQGVDNRTLCMRSVTEESCPWVSFSWRIMCIGICGWRIQFMGMCNGRILPMGKYRWRVLCNGMCSWRILSMGMFKGRISLIVFLLFSWECITEEVSLLLNVLSSLLTQESRFWCFAAEEVFVMMNVLSPSLML